MTELRSGWQITSTSEACGLVQSGGTPKAGFVASAGIPFLKVYNIVDQNIRFEYKPQFVTQEVHEGELRKSKIRPGDVLMNIVGPPLGKVAIVPDTYPEWNANQALTIFRPSAAVSTDWLYYFLCGGSSVQSVINETRGSAGQVNISLSQCRSFEIPLPPPAEQQRIVAKIDSITGKARRARDNLDHVPRLVEKYKQAILAAAFRGDLTREWRAANHTLETAAQIVDRIDPPVQSRGGREATTNIVPGIAGLSVNDPGTKAPEGWSWIGLRRIARQETGHTPSRSKSAYWNGGIPWIGIRDAGSHHGQVIHDTIQTISDEGLANSSARLLPAGTVCLSRTASVGYVTVMGRPMATSQDFATWTCTEALLPAYLMYALIAEGEHIREFGEGSTHTTIYFPEIRALHICLAPLEEQREIVRRVESSFAWIERLAAEATSARKLIDHLDQAVLAKALRGELVPQDPTDEPVSAVLDRIRMERAAAPKIKRGRTRST
ncbi:restriction endonuclease subunit S [Pseudomonas alabamensis]|uniref:restriction endonuclease subunit S n=1 Tax=Pseudomonas alabamensis TaxID=3064349 RepID=UPI000A2F8030